MPIVRNIVTLFSFSLESPYFKGKRNLLPLKTLLLVLLLFSYIAQPAFASDNRQRNISNTEKIDMIIIAPIVYHRYLDSFIEHKNSVGISIDLFSPYEIYGGRYFDVQGCDSPEKIKYFIKNAYDAWNVTYVLFVGNFKQIPVRYCYNEDGYNSIESRFISDLYYADIYDDAGNFSSWDTDGDGIYGEWSGEESQDKNISLTPEICLGRLPCRNKIEVKLVVNKIINYEENTYGSDWFKNMVVAGGDTYSEAGGYKGEQFSEYEGEVNTQKAMEIMTNFDHTKLWASAGDLTTINLIKAINEGCGFLYLSGHGNPSVWVTHPPNSTENVGYLSTPLMPFLVNQYKLPVCVVGGCLNSKFDVTPFNLLKNPKKSWIFSTWIPECWAWKIVSKPFGGAIATLGYTGLSWLGCEIGHGGTNWLELQFFREYANGTDIIGEIWKNAISQYLEEFPIDWGTPAGETSSLDAKTVQEWILLGDPSLKMGGYSS